MRSGETAWQLKVPEDWDIIRLGTCFNEIRQPITDEVGIVTVFRDGEVTLRTNRRADGYTEATDYSLYKLIQPGDLGIHNMDAFAGAIGVSDSEGMCSPVVTICRPKENVNAKYMALVLREMARAGWIEANAKSVRERTSEFRWQMAKVQEVPLPRIETQNAIMDFLDRELAQIDALIAKQVQLIEVLVVRRQSLITNVVSDSTLARNLGLTSSTDDGNWTQTPIKYLTQLNPGVLSEDTNEDLILDYIEIGGVDLANGIFEYTEVLFKDAPSRARRLVSDSDVLVSTVRTYLKAVGQVQASIFNNTIVASTGFAVLRPTRINADFLLYAATSDAFVSEVEARSTGVSYPGISASELVKISIPVPPMETQQLISQYLREQLLGIKQAIANSVNLKVLLQERRQSLISAAVTGKINVRKAI